MDEDSPQRLIIPAFTEEQRASVRRDLEKANAGIAAAAQSFAAAMLPALQEFNRRVKPLTKPPA